MDEPDSTLLPGTCSNITRTRAQTLGAILEEHAMTGSTGHKCPRSGIWQTTDACRTRIALSNGDTFPPCAGCKRGVTWMLVTPT